MAHRIFIDGSAGTTGLRIYDRLSSRKDIELITLSEENRKNPEARSEALNKADVAFLCLPDAAAIEAVEMVSSDHTVIIDTSTAHRISPDWVYGFPELIGQREKIRSSKRIANPGCHASGFISLIAPLTAAGILNPDVTLSCFSLTGYSGGGKKMIAEYESPERDSLLSAPRMYGLTQFHKHLPEMSSLCGLTKSPIFCPIVAPYYAGMEVTVTLSSDMISITPNRLADIYKDYYRTGLVHYSEGTLESGFLSAALMTGRDDMQVSVFGNDERILLVSRFDNLGKGASGAAVQNMNLILGEDEFTGLIF